MKNTSLSPNYRTLTFAKAVTKTETETRDTFLQGIFN